MNITSTCAQSVAEHGVLTSNGVPLGAALLAQPTISVYVAADVGDGTFGSYNFNPEILNFISNFLYDDWALQAAQSNAVLLPENFQTLIQTGISNWYIGKIQFTNNPNDADMHVIAFDNGSWLSEKYNMIVSGTEDLASAYGIPGGKVDKHFSHENITFSEYPVMLLNMSSPLLNSEDTEAIQQVITHEIGHALVGLLHPDDAASLMQDHLVDEAHHSQMPCTEEELEYFMNPQQPAIMAYAHNPADAIMSPYEDGALQIVTGGDAPSARTDVQPKAGLLPLPEKW